MAHKVLMISGKQGSGKSTLADGVEKYAKDFGYTPVRIKFAQVLYEMHDAVIQVGRKYGISMQKKEGELLQYLGTDFGRKLKGENVWVDALVNNVTGLCIQTYKTPKLFIIDDLRFENEFHAFDHNINASAFKIRLEASKETRRERCSYWRENDTHQSEVGLDDYAENGQFDLYISTDGLNEFGVLQMALGFLDEKVKGF